ncbi:16S rRNA (cytosine(967)-C(5))-methyltransferase [Lacticaseibacillus chiayiensis]|uniref:16S rRNA (cytosine(967)-C(5))-methyltransferase n=1 Tax=Lacticaseibacillus chiayiensis TaxID=2100821 RepID=A0A4V1P325_9LACO|nr:16S rRNA (cytosine(967)-C(5))-methyltransferase RsmB [Lacticaseibacillus chiayiensis]QVI33606.1 16S rRNA (cytosine(967)-C(5))-methyltransferase RsmB [Lacticaseibacillus chiayiensis]RXT29540.1 16S rRNA (cytosine(967)-C(5))-methyltransferase [Lacticaseibacillus chiayiensis]UYN55349.1 16S rRNA (cytosine(967)-C(5))-methyltransferase RsmB [Lacticaseibacillus chiayiensis]
MKPNNPRLLAVQTLTRVVGKGGYSNLTLDHAITKYRLDSRDAGLLTNIVYGVIQHQLTLDYLLKPFVKKRQLDPWIRCLLQTAVYQLQYLDKLPARAVFYDSTEIAKQLGHQGIAKFVTGVLREAQRTGFPEPESIRDPIERLAITSSTPIWLVKKLREQLGVTKTASILAAINQPAHASIRVNTTKTTPDALLKTLKPKFPELRESSLTPIGLIAPGGHLAGTPEFAAGDYTMQDESSMLVAPSLDIQPGDAVLDACAAPGGKTTHIAQYLDSDQGGRVTALDLHANKIRLIKQNANRLGLADRVSAQMLDARQTDTTFAPESFDKILVDAPCSGLGLIRRKPEIKYTKQADDPLHLQQIQLAILNSVAPTLKIGGRLTYSTCTMVKEENQDVVAHFLAAHPEFEQVPVLTLKPLTKTHGAPALQLFPDDYDTDGFFIASMIRRK